MKRFGSARVLWILLVFTMLVSFPALTLANEIRVLTLFPSVMQNYLRQVLVPKFEAETGIKVSLELAHWGNRADKIVASVMAGVPYDIVMTGSYSPLEEGALGLLAPLDSFIANWEYRDAFPEPLWKAVQWDGRTYAIPINIDIRAMAYNRGMFAEFGLDPDQPPLSWEEFVAYSGRMTRVVEGQLLTRGFQLSKMPGGSAQEFFWLLRQAGVPEIDVARLTSNLNRPEALDALQVMVEIAEVTEFHFPTIEPGFSSGRVAMARHHPGFMTQDLNANPDLADDYGLFVPRRSPDSQPVVHAFVNGLSILEASKNKEAAWKFLEFLYREENHSAFERSGVAQTHVFFSGRTDMLEHHLEIHPKIQLFFEIFPYLQATVLPPPSGQSQDEVGAMIQQVLRKELHPQEALINMNALWSRLLDEWREVLAQQGN